MNEQWILGTTEQKTKMKRRRNEWACINEIGVYLPFAQAFNNMQNKYCLSTLDDVMNTHIDWN